MKLPNLKSGYSIVELIIYVAVFAVLTVVIANAFIVLVSFFSQTRTNHDLLDNGNTAMERISYEIRNSTSVLGTSVLGTSPGVLELDSVDDSNNPRVVRFEMSNGALNLSYDGNLVGNILGPNMVINSLIFTSAQTDNGDVVKIEMILQDTRDETLRVENFSNIVNTASVELGSSVPWLEGVHAGVTGINLVGGVTFAGDLDSLGPIQSYTSGTNTIIGNVTSGGTSGLIAVNNSFGLNDFTVQGNVFANTVNSITSSGTIYCQTGTGNNQSCDTSNPNPTVAALPDLSSQIADWKAEAEAGGVYNYDVATKTHTAGPLKRSGLQLYEGETLVLTGPLWITGNFTAGVGTSFSQGVKIKLDPSYGSGDGVIIVDGTFSLNSYQSPQAAAKMTVEGSGSPDSYILFIGTASGRLHNVFNMSGNALFYVNTDSTLVLRSGANIKGAIAKKIDMTHGGAYAFSGYDNVTYSTGPAGLNIGKSIFSVTP